MKILLSPYSKAYISGRKKVLNSEPKVFVESTDVVSSESINKLLKVNGKIVAIGSSVLGMANTSTDESITGIPNIYKQVEYLESNGTQCIDTNYIAKANDKIVVECLLFQNTNTSYQAVFGARKSSYSNNAYCFFSRFGNNNIPVYNRSTSETRGTGLIYDKKITITTQGTTASWTDGETSGNMTTNGIVDDCVNSMFMFNLNTAKESDSKPDTSGNWIKIYSFKIYSDEILIRDYVPVYRTIDNVAGMYDKITYDFCPNRGTGVFIIGGDIV